VLGGGEGKKKERYWGIWGVFEEVGGGEVGGKKN
jgi:hypothetical protein